MAAAEQVDEPVGGDGVGTKRGGSVEGLALGVEQRLEPGEGVVEIAFGRWVGWGCLVGFFCIL